MRISILLASIVVLTACGDISALDRRSDAGSSDNTDAKLTSTFSEINHIPLEPISPSTASVVGQMQFRRVLLASDPKNSQAHAISPLWIECADTTASDGTATAVLKVHKGPAGGPIWGVSVWPGTLGLEANHVSKGKKCWEFSTTPFALDALTACASFSSFYKDGPIQCQDGSGRSRVVGVDYGAFKRIRGWVDFECADYEQFHVARSAWRHVGLNGKPDSSVQFRPGVCALYEDAKISDLQGFGESVKCAALKFPLSIGSSLIWDSELLGSSQSFNKSHKPFKVESVIFQNSGAEFVSDSCESLNVEPTHTILTGFGEESVRCADRIGVGRPIVWGNGPAPLVNRIGRKSSSMKRRVALTELYSTYVKLDDPFTYLGPDKVPQTYHSRPVFDHFSLYNPFSFRCSDIHRESRFPESDQSACYRIAKFEGRDFLACKYNGATGRSYEDENTRTDENPNKPKYYPSGSVISFGAHSLLMRLGPSFLDSGMERKSPQWKCADSPESDKTLWVHNSVNLASRLSTQYQYFFTIPRLSPPITGSHVAMTLGCDNIGNWTNVGLGVDAPVWCANLNDGTSLLTFTRTGVTRLPMTCEVLDNGLNPLRVDSHLDEVSLSGVGYQYCAKSRGREFVPGRCAFEKSGLGRCTVNTNQRLPEDTNGDGEISPADSLIVINMLNGLPQSTNTFPDVNGDCYVSATDSLRVINLLNNRDPDLTLPNPVVTGRATTNSYQIKATTGGEVRYVAYKEGTEAPLNCFDGKPFRVHASEFTVSNLLPNRAYSFRVCNINASGRPSSGSTLSTFLHPASKGTGLKATVYKVSKRSDVNYVDLRKVDESVKSGMVTLYEIDRQEAVSVSDLSMFQFAAPADELRMIELTGKIVPYGFGTYQIDVLSPCIGCYRHISIGGNESTNVPFAGTEKPMVIRVLYNANMDPSLKMRWESEVVGFEEIPVSQFLSQ